MLVQKAIEPAQTKWAAALDLSRKKVGTLRFFLAYRRFIDLTTQNSYPILRIDKCINPLGKIVFLTSNAHSEFWKAEIDEKHHGQTVYASHREVYNLFECRLNQWTQLESSSAPDTFLRTMHVMLSCVRWQFASVFVNDSAIFFKLHEQHIDDVLQVSTLPNNALVTLELKKCIFFRETINYL